MSGIVILTIVFVAVRARRVAARAPFHHGADGVRPRRRGARAERHRSARHLTDERARAAGCGADARGGVVRGRLDRPAPGGRGRRPSPRSAAVVGLPLTIALGTVFAVLLFPGAGWAAAALIASILAPTDAALGLAIFTNRAVPVRIRRALNVESGLNDGIVTPFVTLFLTLLVSEEAGGGGHWVVEAGKEIGLALVVAVGVGVVGGALLRAAHRRGFTSGVSEELAILALALLAYLGVGRRSGGTVSSRRSSAGSRSAPRRGGTMHRPTEFTETIGLFASFFVWTVFGALFVGPVLTTRIDATAVAYAVLSLTVIRMVPVAISLLGSRPSTRYRRAHGVVRPPRAGLGRVHARGGRRPEPIRCRVRRDRRGRDVDDPPLGHGPRPDRRPARPRLRTPDERGRERARVDGRA